MSHRTFRERGSWRKDNQQTEDVFYEPKKKVVCGSKGFTEFQPRWIRKDTALDLTCGNPQTLSIKRSPYELPGRNGKLPTKEKESDWHWTFPLHQLADWRRWKSTDSWGKRTKIPTPRFHQRVLGQKDTASDTHEMKKFEDRLQAGGDEEARSNSELCCVIEYIIYKYVCAVKCKWMRLGCLGSCNMFDQ